MSKKGGGSSNSSPLLLIILAVVGGCVLLCVAVCAYLYVRRARKDKDRATNAYAVQQQRSSGSSNGSFLCGNQTSNGPSRLFLYCVCSMA